VGFSKKGFEIGNKNLCEYAFAGEKALFPFKVPNQIIFMNSVSIMNT
jgi:hypothetical protein